jgi:hypothetical protein
MYLVHITARIIYLMCREERLWNVGVLQRVRLSRLVFRDNKFPAVHNYANFLCCCSSESDDDSDVHGGCLHSYECLRVKGTTLWVTEHQVDLQLSDATKNEGYDTQIFLFAEICEKRLSNTLIIWHYVTKIGTDLQLVDIQLIN